MVTARLRFIALLVPVLATLGCPPEKAAKPRDNKTAEGLEDDVDEEARRRKPKPAPIEADRTIRALESEVATLKARLDGATVSYPGSINAHEHLAKLGDVEKYIGVARAAGIGATVVVSSPKFTIDGKGSAADKGEPSLSQNFEESVLPASKKYPGEIIPFCSLDPKDADKLNRLKKHVADGAIGVKMYSGHSNFEADQGPIDDPSMDPVWSYLEETQLPINWHVNLAKYFDAFERVVNKHPTLNLMVPHYGVVFWKPTGPAFARLEALLRAHKNIIVDTSLGTREILIDGMTAMEPAIPQFQKFFEEFQDQIIWGTDSVLTGNVEKTPRWFLKVIEATRDHLEKDVFTTELAAAYSKYYEKGRDGDGRYQGLKLPPAILQKVLIDNAVKWLRLPAKPTMHTQPASAPAAPAAIVPAPKP
jgi:predicted TIM-barrel fold metal-dependent hydrolase